MKNFARIPILVIALLATSTYMKAMEGEERHPSAEDQMQEHRRMMRERFERQTRAEDERLREIAEEQRAEERRHAEAARLATAQENLGQLIRNESIGEILREQLVTAQASTNISNIESMIALAQEELLRKQHAVLDPLLEAATRALAMVRSNLTAPTLGSFLTKIQELEYNVGTLADRGNPLTGEFRDAVGTKIRELNEQHAELEREVQRQALERRTTARTSARTERSRGGPSRAAEVAPAERSATLPQLQDIQERIDLAERTAVEDRLPTATLKNQLSILRRELVTFISECYRQEKNYLLRQAQETKNRLDQKMSDLEIVEQITAPAAARLRERSDEELARQLEAEERQRVEAEHSRWTQ